MKRAAAVMRDLQEHPDSIKKRIRTVHCGSGKYILSPAAAYSTASIAARRSSNSS